MNAWIVPVAGLLLGICVNGQAQSGDGELKRSKHEDWMVKDDLAGFLSSHPDIYNYRLGAIAYGRGEHAKAMAHFRKAARYADKPSQAMIAEMLWNGRGGPQDRAKAYAWADLAAEREYPELVRLRDGFWAELGEAERLRALQVGKEIYAEYGDEVAQPRIIVAMRRAKNNVTGSRTGFTGGTKIHAAMPGVNAPEDSDAPVIMDGTEFFASTYWEPQQYFRWREVQWREQVRQARSGTVDIGELQSLPLPSRNEADRSN